MTPHSHLHGSVPIGRIIVVVACLIILAVDLWIFKRAGAPPNPLPLLQGAVVISLLWTFAGAVGMCRRKAWARSLVLTILYATTFGLFIWGLVVLATADSTLAGGLRPTFIATPVYLIISLVLTHSKHVKRLTSRAYE
jgi:hypothetical protein